MPSIPFSFYSVLGNTFALLDEIAGPVSSEADKSRFARLACREGKGIGADNLLALQRADARVLAEIRDQRRYPLQLPDFTVQEQTPFVFRMFEPDGSEALCCGNGLLAMALHAHCFHQLPSLSILTELPSGSPMRRTIGLCEEAGRYRAELGAPRPVPETFLPPGFISGLDGAFGRFRDFRVPAAPGGDEAVAGLTLSGYAVHTGEPHLVFLETPDAGPGIRPVFANLFDSRLASPPGGDAPDQGQGHDDWLRPLGLAFNAVGSPLFPQGVNLVFARVADPSGILEYRCFERGIRKETLACGTGAAAVAALARHLRLIDSDRIEVRPYRGVQANPGEDASLTLILGPEGSWTLCGSPLLLYRAWDDRVGLRG